MQKLSERNLEILRLIVEEYLSSGKLVGSKSLLNKYDLGVSPATVRGDMAKLEQVDLIFQPYNSAGRTPTTKGLRIYINYMMEQKPDYFIAPREIAFGNETFRYFEDTFYTIVYNLAKNTGEISFLVIPEEWVCKYSWIAEFLDKNIENGGKEIFHVVRMLEERDNFTTFISHLPLEHDVEVFVGEENMIPYLHNYTIIIRKVKIQEKDAYIGILGGVRMDYSFNISAVRGII